MNTYPKRLIEVDLPIKRISTHARREKSIRHGHISTLHIWWARRPLAACRAVICAALWPDPADINCPQLFRNIAASILMKFAEKAVSDKNLMEHCSPENWTKWVMLSKPENRLDPHNTSHHELLRQSLLDFIADFSNWDNSNSDSYLEVSRELTLAAHEAVGGFKDSRPMVIDPFAGGGSIPLEALRIGADTYASDLNSIPVLLNKVVLEYVPTYGMSLVEQVRKWGTWIKNQAEKELSAFYPKDNDGCTPIAYIWARTVVCEGPGCGVEIPLLRSLWLSKRSKNAVAIKIVPNIEGKRVDFEIIENAKASDVKNGTVKRSSATCPCCGYTTNDVSVRRQFKYRSGGARDSRLVAVVLSKQNRSGKSYRTANDNDLKALDLVEKKLKALDCSDVISKIPNEKLPYLRSIFNINLLGVDTWGDLFSSRQLVVITSLVNIVNKLSNIDEFPKGDFGVAVKVALCLAIDRHIDQQSTLVTWIPNIQAVSHTFVRQALGITWDFCEPNPLTDSGGNLDGAFEWVSKVLERESGALNHKGTVQKVSADNNPLPDDSAHLLCTDPPYYDAVPYADLSDYFYVWLRRMLINDIPSLFNDELSNKSSEIVQLAERNEIYSYKTKDNFEKLMTKALSEARRVVNPQGIGVIVFAHKDTSAWETMLASVIDSGWIVVASWPIDTERTVRLRAMNSAALGSSIHLVCRPRENSDGTLSIDKVGDWRDVLAELPKRIHEWMPRLAAEGVVGADAIFACLGPALEIFSQYSRVEKASGEQVMLREYLEQIWAVVAKEALDMIFAGAETSGFEADARLTAMWLWTLFAGNNGEVDSAEGTDDENDDEESGGAIKTSGGFTLEYDAARKIAQGLGANLEKLRSLVELKGETARLLPVNERAVFLFGKDAGQMPEKKKKRELSPQLDLFKVLGINDSTEKEWDVKTAAKIGETVLDRLHQSMILFAAGRGEALKRFLVEDGVGRDQRFWRLAQAFSALYPSATDEKRWVDGVLARKKGLGF